MIFILNDPTLVSINHIQQAHKKADNGFNDVVAQLYDLEFRKQEILKEDRIKEAKEKAIEQERIAKKQAEDRRQAELERVAEENRKRAEQEALERAKETVRADNENKQSQHDEATQTTQNSTGSAIASDWASVSPEQASQYMSSKTGVSASKWLDVIYKESSGNPYAENPLTCWGLLQIMQSLHGQVSNLSPQAYLDKAVSIYQNSGGTAWETW